MWSLHPNKKVPSTLKSKGLWSRRRELNAGWREPEIAWTEDSCDLVMVAEDVTVETDPEGWYTSAGAQLEKT